MPVISALRALGEDAGVRWLVLGRLLALAGAPITLWLALTRLTDAERALYLIAVNVASIGPLLETGPGTLVVQYAARGGEVAVSILRLARRWYARAAAVVLVVVGLGGLFWLRGGDALQLDAVMVVWALLALSVAGYVVLVPALCLLEGGEGRVPVQRLRATQAALTLALLVGGLWSQRGYEAAALAAFGALVLALSFVGRHRPTPSAASRHRYADLVAIEHYMERQRRSALTWLALWAAPQALTPLVWRVASPEVAGVVGIHVGLALAPAMLAMAWMHARFPSFGRLAATGSRESFDAAVRRATSQAVSVFLATSAVLIGFIIALRTFLPVEGAHRLSVALTLLLLVGSLALLLVQAMLAWLRAFTEEPLTIAVSVAAGLALLGGSLGALEGDAIGSGLGHALGSVVGFVIVAAAFNRARTARLSESGGTGAPNVVS